MEGAERFWSQARHWFPACEERRGEHDEHRLQELESDAGSAVHRTNTSSAIRVMKL